MTDSAGSQARRLALIGFSISMSRLAAAQAPAVAASVVPEFVSLQPGTSFRVAVRLVIPDGWHISWKRPGQSGLPTTLTWRLPAGITDSIVEWPFPERSESAGVVSHVYRGEVIIVSSFRVGREAPVGIVDLVGRLAWGLCREICIPQERQLSLSLPIETGPPQRSQHWAAVAAAAASRLPASPDFLTIRSTAVADDLMLVIEPRQGTVLPAGLVTFFPEDSSQTAVATTAQSQVVRGAIVLAIPGMRRGLSGVLVAERGWGGLKNPLALNIHLSVQGSPRNKK